MSYIADHISKVNSAKRKALSIFLTVGFPDKGSFVDLAKAVFDNGADMIELGIPFSDPLADGPVIQHSSEIALQNGITVSDVLSASEKISSYSDKPVILMGYANPIKRYGIESFVKDAHNAGAKGVIVPDIPIEEYDSFFGNKFNGLDTVLLTTPTSTEARIKSIDEKSRGFVYCVSVTGTTGQIDKFSNSTLKNLERTYSLLSKNKMMIGFGISKQEDVKSFAPYCDGVIVGSAVVKALSNGKESALKLIADLSSACSR